MASLELHGGELRARIGNNEARGRHLAGYNGVWSLTARGEDENLFVPFYAGLNFEHIFDGYRDGTEVLFEPRRAPMMLRPIARNKVQLYQPPTPFWGLESWTTFELVAPCFIDMTFRCTPRKTAYRYGYIGLFWASYINQPEDKSLYFRGRSVGDQPRNLQLCTQLHNDESTVVHVRQSRPRLRTRPRHRPMLFTNYSPLCFEEPLMFGRWRNRVFAVLFDRAEGIRLAHSPSGGGVTADGSDTHPAWDWQFIIPRYQLHREYGFRIRTVFKKYAGREELWMLRKRWLSRSVRNS